MVGRCEGELMVARYRDGIGFM